MKDSYPAEHKRDWDWIICKPAVSYSLQTILKTMNICNCKGFSPVALDALDAVVQLRDPYNLHLRGMQIDRLRRK